MSRKLAALDELDDYLVKIVGWDCETQAPSATASKRGVLVERDVNDDLTGDDLWDNFDESNQNALVMSLGDLEAGSYTYDLNLVNGTIVSAFVVDYLGDTFYNSTSDISASSNPQSITFTLPSAAAGVGLIALTDDTNITLNYVAQNVPAAQSSSTAATSTSSGAVSTSPANKSEGSIGWHKKESWRWMVYGWAVFFWIGAVLELTWESWAFFKVILIGNDVLSGTPAV